jgi:hypothetical protein
MVCSFIGAARQLKQNISRIRTDIRRDVRELSALMDADQDFTHVALRLMRSTRPSTLPRKGRSHRCTADDAGRGMIKTNGDILRFALAFALSKLKVRAIGFYSQVPLRMPFGTEIDQAPMPPPPAVVTRRGKTRLGRTEVPATLRKSRFASSLNQAGGLDSQ